MKSKTRQIVIISIITLILVYTFGYFIGIQTAGAQYARDNNLTGKTCIPTQTYNYYQQLQGTLQHTGDMQLWNMNNTEKR